LAKRRWQLNLLRLSNKQAAKTANHSVKLPRYLAVPKNASSWQQDPLLIWWDGRLAWDCDFIIFGSLPGTLTHMSGSLHMLDGGTEKNHGIFCGCIQQLPKRWFSPKTKIFAGIFPGLSFGPLLIGGGGMGVSLGQQKPFSHFSISQHSACLALKLFHLLFNLLYPLARGPFFAV